MDIRTASGADGAPWEILIPLFRCEKARSQRLGSKPVPRKYPAMVLLLEKLIKIDIHRLVRNDCWAATVGDYRLELNPTRNGANYFLTLNVNDVPTPRRWMLSTRPIRGDYSAAVASLGTIQKFGMCIAPMGDAVLTCISILPPVQLARAMSMARDIVGIVCLPRNGKLKSCFGRRNPPE